MSEETLATPLTEDELQSLCWIAAVATRIAIPVAHLDKLLGAGYIIETVTGPVLTDLGEYVLGREVDGKGGQPNARRVHPTGP
jgi:hypothetical protein